MSPGAFPEPRRGVPADSGGRAPGHGAPAGVPPFVVEGKVRFEVEYRHSEVADWICRIPNLPRVDALTTRVDAPDFESALRMYYAQGAMLWRFDAY